MVVGAGRGFRTPRAAVVGGGGMRWRRCSVVGMVTRRMITVYLDQLFLARGRWEEWVVIGLVVEADRMRWLTSGWRR